MTNSQSKFFKTVASTCKDFHHPWTDSCADATIGIVIATTMYGLRLYPVFYLTSILIKRRMPNMKEMKKMFSNILRSTGFISITSFSIIMFGCLLRNILGCFYLYTAIFTPAFFSSLLAINFERPQRRPMLALYAANLATETLWNMAETRGLVRSIPNGQTLIFGLSISVLLYLHRLGLHKTTCKDGIYNLLQICVGKAEEGPIKKCENEERSRSRPPVNITTINGLVQIYLRFLDFIKGKHASCPHRESCLKYAVFGGLKPFVGGVTLQVTLKLVMNIKKIVQMKMDWQKNIFNRSTLNLGIFLGSFSLLYKSVSCLLRHSVGRDDPLFAIPAGLIGSIAFTKYPNVTVALYIMWKTLQLCYNLGIERSLLPEVSGFVLYLYSASVAILCHGCIFEPNTVRPSFLKFMNAVSGGRFFYYNTTVLDALNPGTSQQREKVMQKLKMSNRSSLPKFAIRTGL